MKFTKAERLALRDMIVGVSHLIIVIGRGIKLGFSDDRELQLTNAAEEIVESVEKMEEASHAHRV